MYWSLYWGACSRCLELGVCLCPPRAPCRKVLQELQDRNETLFYRWGRRGVWGMLSQQGQPPSQQDSERDADGAPPGGARR